MSIMNDVLFNMQSKLEGDQFGEFVFRSAVFAHQQADVLHLVICFIVLDFPVVRHLREVPLPVSSDAHHFTLILSAQSLHHLLRIEGSAHYFRPKRVRSLQQFLLPNLLAFVNVGVELGSILHIRPQESGIRHNCSHFLLTIEVVLLWVLESIVVVLDGRCEDESLLLRGELFTSFAKSAVSSMSLVLEVVEWK
jgi:hypothetical protein